tara:strand:- start:467 stop:1135 length:669 start_codon:yes stop_codon:yes gene_type:complete
MHVSLEKLTLVKNKINEIIAKKQLKINPKVIIVSKTFTLDKIKPLIDSGHLHFGENKIQEAEDKWSVTKKNNKDLMLHMVGSLQSNKAKKAVQLFDFIHSLDSKKLAIKLNQYQKEMNKKIKFFIQVNLAEEEQKSGISLNEISNFYSFCTKELQLNIIGLMCLPPINSNAKEYFELLKKKADDLGLKELSMGMSGDFEDAISSGSTYLRLGTAILGQRNTK